MPPTAVPVADASQRDARATPEQTPTRRSLTPAACLALLSEGGHGRVAATMGALPVIIPVNFTLVGADVVVNPGSGPGLAAAIANNVVAFEADHVGPHGHAQWGVHLIAVARTVNHPTGAASFRLSCEIITGWRAGN